MALIGVELETNVSEPDALTIRPPPRASITNLTEDFQINKHKLNVETKMTK